MDLPAYQGILLVGTNLVLVWPIVWTGLAALWFEFTVLMAVFLASVAHHICMGWPSICSPGTADAFTRIDITLATYAFAVVAVYVAYIRVRSVRHVLWVSLLVVAFATALLSNETFLVGAILGALGLTIILVSWAIAGRVPQYDWPDFIAGLILGALAVLSFVLDTVFPDLYWIFHSLWHIFAFFSAYFLLETRTHRVFLIFNRRDKERAAELDLLVNPPDLLEASPIRRRLPTLTEEQASVLVRAATPLSDRSMRRDVIFAVRDKAASAKAEAAAVAVLLALRASSPHDSEVGSNNAF